MAANRKTSKNGKNRKSMKMSKEDLTEMVKAAVKEAMDEQKTDGEEPDGDGGIESILTEVLESINEKRKSADQGALSDEEAGEIIDAISSFLDDDEGEKGDGDEGEEKGEGDDDEDDDDEEKGRKSAVNNKQTKSGKSTPQKKTVQRKYSNIFMNRDEPAKQKKSVPAGIMLARAIKCIDVFGRNDPERASFYAKKNYQDDDMAKEFKALSVTGPSNGGYLIPEVYMDQIIEMLYPKTVIFELGAQKVPLDNGNLNMPKMTAGTRATWRGEQRKISAATPKFGNIRLSAKSLTAIVPQSRELMMSTSYSADAIFANDLTRRMQLGLDYGGLYGNGGEFMPLGIYHNKEVEKINVRGLGNDSLASSDGKISADFPVYLRSKAMNKNIDDQSLGWTMNSMLEGYFMNLKTTTGAYIYREEMQTGKLLGAPYKISNQIPSKNGRTDLFFGNWSDLLIGDQMGLETYTTLDGTWTDDEGAMHSAFDENMAATRATMYDDIAVRHGESFLVATDIKVM